MPFTDDHSIATCAADGQVRHVEISGNGQVKSTLLSCHKGRAHKLAIEPGSPRIFYTCGEDGLVQRFDLRTPISTCSMLFKCYQQNNSYKPVDLYAISIDPRRPNLFAVGGRNNYARLYDIRKYKHDGSVDCGQPIDCFCPPHLTTNKRVKISGLAFSEQSELLVSYNNENIYLFTSDMGSGPYPEQNSCSMMSDSDNDESSLSANSLSNSFSLGKMAPQSYDESSLSDKSLLKSISIHKMAPQSYIGHVNRDTVKGVSFFGPNSDYVISGSDCCHMFIWKKKGGALLRAIKADKYVVNCIESHPHTMVLASSGIENDVKIWHPQAEKASLHELSSRVPKRRPLHFDVDLYTDDREDYDDEDESQEITDEDNSMDEYDHDEDYDDEEDDEYNYETYESCDSGESDHDIAFDDDPAVDSSLSDD